jgi:hypothetical protein
MTGLALLAVIWVVGLVLYFHFTTERDRENYLLIMWGLLLLPCIIAPLAWALGF